MRRFAVCYSLAILAFIALGVGVIGATTPYLGYLRTSCTVGVIGAAASVTIEGRWAGRSCYTWEHESRGQYYSRPVNPQEPMICQYSRDDQRITVRDTGMLMLVGNNLCSQLRYPSYR